MSVDTSFKQSYYGNPFSMNRKVQHLFLVLLFISPTVIMPLSTPVISDVVVLMYHDNAVHTAVRTITNNVPNVKVIEYNSLEYMLTVHRICKQVVWVSHGSEEGIATQNGIMKWKDFSHRVDRTPGKDIVLACGSANINKYVPSGDAVGIDGRIDARLAGLVGSAFILSQKHGIMSEETHRILNAGIDLISKLACGRLASMPLGPVPCYWGLIKAAAIGIIATIYFASGEAHIPSALAATSHPVLFGGLVTFFFSIIGYLAYLALGWGFPSAQSFVNWANPILGAVFGVVLSYIIGGALPGASYFIIYLGGWLASLFGVQVSWAAPYSRAAFASSAAICFVSAIDILFTAY